MDSINQLSSRLRAFYAGLSPRRRAALGVILAISAVSTVALVAYARRPQWTPLVDDIEPSAQRTLVESLRGEGYQVKVLGDQVLVPAASLDEARLAAYGSDMGSTLPGMTLLLDRKGMGLTREQERATYQVALQGELAQTIRRLSSVRRASVQLVLPEDSLFPEDRVTARASVMVDLRPGGRLSASQVTAVTNLVAASVPRLSPADVVVADTEGNLLTRPIDEEGVTAGVDRMMEYTREIERSLEAKALAQLDRMVGADHAEVQVTATVDTSHQESSAVDYDGGRAAARSIQSSEMEETGGQSVAMGVPGTGANMPEVESGGGGGTSASNARSANELLNYEIPQTTKHTVQPPGSLMGLSVSVLVDGVAEVDPATGEEAFAPRSDEELADISAVVAAAVGLDESRGDSITVVSVPFQTATLDEAAAASGGWWTGIPWAAMARWLVVGLLIALVYLVVIRPMMGAVVAPERAPAFDAEGRPIALLETRSPQFQNKMRQITGGEIEHEGDPLAGLLRADMPTSIRALRDWIEEG